MHTFYLWMLHNVWHCVRFEKKIFNGYWIRLPSFFTQSFFRMLEIYWQKIVLFVIFCSLTGFCHPSLSLHQHHITEYTVPLRNFTILVKFIDIMKAIFRNVIFILVMWSIKWLLSIHKQSQNSSHTMFALLSQFPLITSKDSTQIECY